MSNRHTFPMCPLQEYLSIPALRQERVEKSAVSEGLVKVPVSGRVPAKYLIVHFN